ncbi:MAG TPA: ferric reductase-like transmembrane domain-containing protein [Anaerolineales bacterium]|nr:ferric reductase-like transmembrane domain-containing protein [Anaerolineales bacterium]
MIWLKSNGRWLALNLFALSVMGVVLSQGSTDLGETEALDPLLTNGKWAIRFLLICLSMTPLNTYFGWSQAVRLRKPAGLWAFGFAALHVLVNIREAQFTWLEYPVQPFILPGALGLLILIALAVTSNRWAMRRLRKNWKRLHRLVYLAGNLVILHAMLATTASKRIALRDPQAVRELQAYFALLLVLLVVRIPRVRRALLQVRDLLRRKRPILLPVIVPDELPEYWPQVYGREDEVYLDDLYPETQPEEEAEGERVMA